LSGVNVIGGGVRALGTALWLSWRSARGLWRQSWAGDPLAKRSLAEALGRFVWEPLPVLIALAALIGLILGLLAAQVLYVYNAELLVIGTLVETMLRHVLPLIIGIFASGSVSVELASRLSAMSLAHEIDALESMGHDPAAFTLGAPLAAVLAASPLHMTFAAIAALIAAAVPLHLSANLPWGELLRAGYSAEAASALLTGVGKAFVFAWIAFGVGAAVGRRPALMPGEIGRRAGQAFTRGLLAIFTAAAIWVAVS
jgi:ABC-type transporter Mla maintaining outer membrane lipid asymmetry permease subunit MlaE